MGKFGDKLRRERELRAVTLDEIAEATKIGTRSLKALEDEQFDLLPGGIFNKGFVRAYAKYLGIDEEQSVADYTAAVGEATGKFSTAIPDEALVQSIAKKRTEEKPIGVDNGGTSKVWIGLAVLALAGFGAYSGWNYYQQRRAQKHQQQTELAPPHSSADQSVTVTPTDATVATATPATEQIAPQTLTNMPVKESATATASTTTPVGPEFTVTLHTKEEAWVSIQADGKTIIESLLTPDSSRTITARDRVVMKVGKPGAIEVSFNGTPVGPLGPPDKTVTKTFTVDGMQ